MKKQELEEIRYTINEDLKTVRDVYDAMRVIKEHLNLVSVSDNDTICLQDIIDYKLSKHDITHNTLYCYGTSKKDDYKLKYMIDLTTRRKKDGTIRYRVFDIIKAISTR